MSNAGFSSSSPYPWRHRKGPAVLNAICAWHRVYTPSLSTGCTPLCSAPLAPLQTVLRDRLLYSDVNWPHSYQLLDIHSSNPSPCCCTDLIWKRCPGNLDAKSPVWLPGEFCLTISASLLASWPILGMIPTNLDHPLRASHGSKAFHGSPSIPISP